MRKLSNNVAVSLWRCKLSKRCPWLNVTWFLLPAILAQFFGCSPPVATVNGEHITAKEFRHSLEHTYGAQTLRWLITKQLLEEENERLKLVTDADVDRAFEEFKASRGGEAQFQLWLKRNNRTEEDVREDLKRDLIMFRLRASKVSEKELEGYYERNKHLYLQPPMVRLFVIMNSNRETILKAKSELDAGKSFGIVARRYSDIRFLKATGGELGDIPNGYYRLPQTVWAAFYQHSPGAFEVIGDFNANVWKVINTAPLNRIVGPVRGNRKWIIFKVAGKRGAYQLPLKQVREDVLMRYLNEIGPSELDIENELWRRAKIQIHWDEYKPLEDIYKEAEWMKLPHMKPKQSGTLHSK
ncbi:MAG: peptidyl-prolyl cis-trans isomerase [Armatimonadota bacterium]|nr:peptidyl-prolyl cis-trans isomerase [Armatimonadota bacterium]MCX7778294.1 peptidyl-prolyl cis-trans isomerase [Armatimonadota bacterium]MDW8026318.1 peptidyl-prolyl cis-trans isomerase [Armatimonadota bacterium]